LKSTTIKRTNVLWVAGQIQQTTITTSKPFNVKKNPPAFFWSAIPWAEARRCRTSIREESEKNL
jgi:hypothetical protein